MIDDMLQEGDRLRRRLERSAIGSSADDAGRAALGLKSEMTNLLDDVASLLRNEAVVNPELKTQLDEKFRDARSLLSNFAEETRDAGRRFADETQQRVNDGLDASRAAVIERPLSSVAVAAAVGMVFGVLLGNRR